MSYVVNIANHLENQTKFLKIGPNDEDVVRVYDDKNTFVKVQEILDKDESLKGIDKALELLLKKEGLKKINDLNLSVEAYKTVFIGVMACVQSKTFEETEKAFRSTL